MNIIPLRTKLALLSGCALAGAAQAAVFTASLDGASESPPVVTTGTGSATVTYDGVAHTLRVEISFSDLVSPTTVAHIHAPTALAGAGTIGVAVHTGTFPGFPAGVTSGTYDHTLDLTDSAIYTANFFNLNGGTAAGAEAGLLAAMLEGKAYVNVHTQANPGGEIRGFLALVPEPATYAWVAGLGLCGFALWRRLRAVAP